MADKKNESKSFEGKETRKRRDGKSNRNGKTKMHTAEKHTAANDRLMGGSNHPEWYAYSPLVMESAANLYYSTPLGTPVTQYDRNYRPECFPGIMTLRYTPMFGVSNAAAPALSPINVAAQSLYSFVRHANSGSKNYEAPDLMMYVMAMDSLYIMYAEAKRAYGIARTYSMSNRFYPRAILTALGWNADDILANLADFRTTINNLAYAMGSFAVPGDMSYFARHLWMSSHIWVDSSSRKAQSYAYRASGIWQWEGFEDTQGTRLSFRRWNDYFSSSVTVAEFAVKSMTMVNDYLRDEDVGIMTGDMKKAFGAEKLLVLNLVPEDYAVYPEYDEALCSQIQNAVILMGNPKNPITQNKGRIICDGVLDMPDTDECVRKGGILNLRMDNPTPSDTMVASRLSNFIRDMDYDIPKRELHLFTCGSEYITSVNMWSMGANGSPITISMMGGFKVDDTMTGADLLLHIDTLAEAEKFDWHPYCYWYYDSNGVPQQMRFSGDIDNFTTYTTAELVAMNDVALLTMLQSPAMGTFNPATFLRV